VTVQENCSLGGANMVLQLKNPSLARAPPMANCLFRKLIKLEYTLLTEIWIGILECFNKINEKLQIPALDVCEVYFVLSSLNVFIDVQR
jgi:hypothetical protein